MGGGSHCDISVYEYFLVPRLPTTDRSIASPERKVISIATVIRASRKKAGWLIALLFLGRAAHAYIYLRHFLHFRSPSLASFPETSP